MKKVKYVYYGGFIKSTTWGIKSDLYTTLQPYIDQGIDVTKPSVFVLSYEEFLSKDLNNQNYYNAFRSMTENLTGGIYNSSKEIINRMYDICNKIKNTQQLDWFDLSFCDLLLNPFAFSFYYTNTKQNNEWPSGVIFCLKDRIDKDAENVWGNEPYYCWRGSQAILCDNAEQVRACIRGMFKKISSKEDYELFENIFNQFKSLAGNYLEKNKQLLFLDEYGNRTEPNLCQAQIDYIQRKNKQKREYNSPTYEIVEMIPE